MPVPATNSCKVVDEQVRVPQVQALSVVQQTVDGPQVKLLAVIVQAPVQEKQCEFQKWAEQMGMGGRCGLAV